MNKLRATILLFLATFIWGTSFIAQDIAADYLGAFMFNAFRSLIGFVVLLLFILYKNKWSLKKLFDYKIIKISIICGLILFASINLQQMGMILYPKDVAASSRTAFITAIYVVIVTIIGTISSRKLNILIILSCLLAMAGLYFVCIYGNESGIYLGDILVFGCAVGFAIHIILLNKHPEVDGVKTSCMQLLVSGLLSLIVGLIVEDYSLTAIINCLGPLLYVGILSSGVAYTIEVIALQILNASVASVIMSSESVIALICSAIILNEKLKPYEYLGCFIVMVALILAQIPELSKAISNHK